MAVPRETFERYGRQMEQLKNHVGGHPLELVILLILAGSEFYPYQSPL